MLLRQALLELHKLLLATRRESSLKSCTIALLPLPQHVLCAPFLPLPAKWCQKGQPEFLPVFAKHCLITWLFQVIGIGLGGTSRSLLVQFLCADEV